MENDSNNDIRMVAFCRVVTAVLAPTVGLAIGLCFLHQLSDFLFQPITPFYLAYCLAVVLGVALTWVLPLEWKNWFLLLILPAVLVAVLIWYTKMGGKK